MFSAKKSTPVPNQIIELHQLPLNQWATIHDLQSKNKTDSHLLLRLSEIGFVPGEEVCIVAAGRPGYEPLAVRVGRSTFALRRNEAALVQVMAQSVIQSAAITSRQDAIVQKEASHA